MVWRLDWITVSLGRGARCRGTGGMGVWDHEDGEIGPAAEHEGAAGGVTKS